MGFSKRKTAATGFAVIVAALIAVVLIMIPEFNAAPVHAPLLAPDAQHVLGTDSSGRDIFILLIISSGVSLAIGFFAAFAAVLSGAFIGCTAGYSGPPAEDLLMRLTDVFLLVPTLPLIIVLSAYAGQSPVHVALVIAVTSWPSTARIVHARVLTLKEQPFVINAKSMGAGNVYIMIRHILPNCTELLLAKGSLGVASAMTAEAGIGFLGLNDSQHPSWGSMLHDAFSGAALINGYVWWYLPPVLSISFSVVLFNLAGHYLAGAEVLSHHTAVEAFPVTLAEGPVTKQDVQTPLLSVQNLTIGFKGPDGQRNVVVDRLDLDLVQGENVAVIGATGSGKSLLLLSILGLLPPDARSTGEIRIDGADLAGYSPEVWQRHRGVFAAYVPQALGEALNPVLTVGDQVIERLRIHRGLGRKKALDVAACSLSSVGFTDSRRLLSAYPHHLSGGMKQRVLLAMALSGDPALILADEPTKGLDPEAVLKILEIFRHLGSKTVFSVTHDLVFAKALSQRVLVMYSGVAVETAPSSSFFREPFHPYSRALVSAGLFHETPETRIFGTPVDDGVKGGCPYRYSCLKAMKQCSDFPPMVIHGGHRVRCWLYVS